MFLIPTYNRPDMLLDLLKQIAKCPYDYKVKIYNDHSKLSYKKVIDYLPDLNEAEYYRTPENHGKQFFWLLNDLMYHDMEKEEFDYCVNLADDLELVEGFFEKAVRYHELSGADLLNILAIESMNRMWRTGDKPRFEKEGVTFIQANWIDGAFICTRKYFEKLNYACPCVPLRRWEKLPNSSSGVGAVLSGTFYRAGGTVMQLERSLVIHRSIKSVINTHRKDPLIAYL